jgi:hypothetical protein
MLQDRKHKFQLEPGNGERLEWLWEHKILDTCSESKGLETAITQQTNCLQ